MIVAGAVDNGKSSVLGRLLCEYGQLGANQKKKIYRDERIDPSRLHLLTDGLRKEQFLNRTIDVSYHYLYLSNQRVLLADAPGHQEYIANMATASSMVSQALFVIDVQKGMQKQAYVHLDLLQQLGVRDFVLLVNKMDLVADEEASFRFVEEQVQRYFSESEWPVRNRVVPVSAHDGRGLSKRLGVFPWFAYEDFEQILFEEVPKQVRKDFRFPVQLAFPHQEQRLLMGTDLNRNFSAVEGAFFYSDERLYAIDSWERCNSPEDHFLTLRVPKGPFPKQGDVVFGGNAPLFGRHVTTRVLSFLPSVEFEKEVVVKLGPLVETATWRKKENVENHSIFEFSFSRAVSYELFETNKDLGHFLVFDPRNGKTLAIALIQE